jgi:hypothetical protein
MKKIFYILVLFSLFFLPFSHALAVHVNGYYRSNGTYVNGYERTAPDSSPYNNYGYPGNYNPNTGSITGGSQSTYLNNYYKSSSGLYSAPSISTYSPTYSTYSSTPSCPLHSYSSGSSCKCNSGYLAKNGSCVSADSVCWDDTGYSSSYDILSNSCKCNSGYVLNSAGRCTSADLVCSDKIGVMSRYNSLTNKCECMVGYEFDGLSCKYKSSSSSYSPSYSGSYSGLSSCPANSSASLTSIGKCTCNSGYKINANKDACVEITAKDNDKTCQKDFGTKSKWAGTSNASGTINCICKDGYEFSSKGDKCVKIKK